MISVREWFRRLAGSKLDEPQNLSSPRDYVVEAGDHLSRSFNDNIYWYRRAAEFNRRSHYITLLALIGSTTIAPVLTAITLTGTSSAWLKAVTILLSCAVTMIAAVRSLCQFEKKWHNFFVAKLEIQEIKRKYKVDRARVRDNRKKFLDLIEASGRKLNGYIQRETAQFFEMTLKAVADAEKSIRRPKPK